MKDLNQFLPSLFDRSLAAAPFGRYTVAVAAMNFVFFANALGQTKAPQSSPDQEMRAIDTLLREVNEPATAPGVPAAVPSLTVAQATAPTSLKQEGAVAAVPPQDQTQLLPSAERPPVSANTSNLTSATNAAALPVDQAPNAAANPSPNQGTQAAAKNSEHIGVQTSQAGVSTQENGKHSDPPSFLEEVIESNKNSYGIWKNLGVAVGLLLAISLAVFQYSRNRGSNQTKPGRAPKALQLVATLPISPKRQVLLIRVRDTEIAVAATEHGLSLLSEVKESNAQAIESLAAAKVERSPRPLPIPDVTESIPARLAASNTRETKSEILKKALESIENKRAKQNRISSDEPEYEVPTGRDARQNLRGSVPAQADGPTTATLPSPGTPRLKKFFANSYKQSTDRETEREQPLTSTRATIRSESGQAQSEETGSSQTDNVAQLIRDKLKQMRAIN